MGGGLSEESSPEHGDRKHDNMTIDIVLPTTMVIAIDRTVQALAKAERWY
jgi:hypothetical protein